MLALLLLVAATLNAQPETDVSRLDDLSALWNRYKYQFLDRGRVIALDENGITTSEGQSYALLRAVWEKDHDTFDRVWHWTQAHLQRKSDKLFSWKWKNRILDVNSATDADTDIALALILAARRFDQPGYRVAARQILSGIWNSEVLKVGNHYYVTAGNWSPAETFPALHVAYLAPYAYQVFAGEDSHHPWKRLIDGSYRLLRVLYQDKKLTLPPEVVYLDKRNDLILLARPGGEKPSAFGYDDVPLFWRIALDEVWFDRGSTELRRRMLAFFETEWKRNGRFWDRYDTKGNPLSRVEGLPLYASVHALASIDSPELAKALEARKLRRLRQDALRAGSSPYYLQNWLWFDLAFECGALAHFDEFLGFLRPFDFQGFASEFPWYAVALLLMLYPFASYRPAKTAFLATGFYLCGRYLCWRLFHSLNFLEPFGPVISLALWAAELYAFSTVALLLLQVGLGRRPAPLSRSDASYYPANLHFDGRLRSNGRPSSGLAGSYAPSVDVLIPIYSETLDILEKTLIAATAMDYPNKQVHVCDDSHREEVARLAAAHGARYHQGPKKHAKAGNLNQALTRSNGELVVVFDTDHIPATTFLSETVPYFADASVGFLQTPHHFYNQDIFQRAFHAPAAVPNEQDMFNHAIQAGRAGWGGAFFVGSGAVFRRAAIDSVGGFNLMSITEDIHTSQHLHARGWRSVFVDKDLAVGLTAENLASYIVQRRRWMLGCLQIFFKDNPLFCRGLGWRHRLGYFASLYYFFFPLARVVFWLTPLCFLLFHLHPMLTEVSRLLAYLVPFALALPMMSAVILPKWPRLGWGAAYEAAVAAPLARSVLDLCLPKNLGFKVTPKGIVSERRAFDLASSKLTLMVAAVTAIAILKGLAEASYFGIEKDAYFFNLGWAIYNLGFLAVALLVAWERPQRRRDERVATTAAATIAAGDIELAARMLDVSLSGISLELDGEKAVPSTCQVSLPAPFSVQARARLIHREAREGVTRCGLAFTEEDPGRLRNLVLGIFANPHTWETSHQPRARHNLSMAAYFLKGVLGSLLPPFPRRMKLLTEERKAVRIGLDGGLLMLAALILMSASPCRAGSWSEAWYTMRGKSNMDIGNYRAAMEAFEKAVEKNPENAETRRLLAKSYEAQGLTDKAIEQYDQYLNLAPSDSAIAFKQAKYLTWSRYAYRRKDALKYYKMGLKQRDDPKVRLKYAMLLAENKETSSQAIEEFQRVLAKEPRNGLAHRGLAEAYAWQGQNDLALEQGELARQYGAGDFSLRKVERDLSRGREPEAAAAAEMLIQPGSQYGLYGFSLTPKGRIDISPFLTTTMQMGYEHFWGGGDSVDSMAFRVGGQYRLDPENRLNAAFGYHTLHDAGDNFEGVAEYEHGSEGDGLRAGFKRTLRDDSLMALAGTVSGRSLVGAARSNLFYADVPLTSGALKFGIAPFVGWVSSQPDTLNFEVGTDATARVELASGSRYQLGAEYRVELSHYGEDRSGFAAGSPSEPLAGGYFSPSLFLSQTPALVWSWHPREKDSVSAELGPSFQIVSDNSSLGTIRWGGDAHINYSRAFSKSWRWQSGAGYTGVGSIYQRYQLGASLVYIFR